MNKYKEQYKEALEKNGYEVTITDDEIKVVNKNYPRQYVVFNRKNEQYTAMEFGSEVTFATCPIYKDWFNLILVVHYNRSPKLDWSDEEDE